ncbi:GDSL-type esterase/lipase family protein [Microbacterium sp. YY-01]|uniref:GDSL-type esterase/lipase family protein n=1 Tax=Microbacterium sp. YY-01 TaxID=3421634 RepID=UPI003D17C8F4
MTALHPVPSAVLHASVRGAAEVVQNGDGRAPLRMPAALEPLLPSPALAWVYGQTAGVRLALRTAATQLQLAATFTRNAGPDRAMLPVSLAADVDGVTRWTAEIDEGHKIVGTATGDVSFIAGNASTLDIVLPPTDRQRAVDIWLPHRAQTVLHTLAASAPVTAEPAESADGARLRWVHHGSSISHGHEARFPTTTWPQLAARELGWELTDLGFSGNAMLDPWVAQRIAATPADIISLKVGINIVGSDAFTQRSFVPALHGFLDTIRQAHPRTPVVMMTAVACPLHENTPGPTVGDGSGRFVAAPVRDSLTLTDTRELIAHAVEARNDPALALIDGLSLLNLQESDYLHDGLHPDAAGLALIARRAVPQLRDCADRLLPKKGLL